MSFKKEAMPLRLGCFKHMGRTGVIYVMSRARAMGYSSKTSSNWANLGTKTQIYDDKYKSLFAGQGAPECGIIPGQPHRGETVHLTEETSEYAPILGDLKLRKAVANYYNKTFRKGKDTMYTYENVAITAGGRMGLTRVAASYESHLCSKRERELFPGCLT